MSMCTVTAPKNEAILDYFFFTARALSPQRLPGQPADRAIGPATARGELQQVSFFADFGYFSVLGMAWAHEMPRLSELQAAFAIKQLGLRACFSLIVRPLGWATGAEGTRSLWTWSLTEASPKKKSGGRAGSLWGPSSP
jgi:hypothetical protein